MQQKFFKALKYSHNTKQYLIENIPFQNIIKPDEQIFKVVGFCINRVDLLQQKNLYSSSHNSNIHGLEFVGYKVDQKTLKVNDSTLYGGVVYNGSYAQYLSTNTKTVIPLEFDQNLDQKIAIPEAFFTAYQLTKYYSGLKENQIAYVVAGASGVGNALIQILKKKFKCKVIASTSNNIDKQKFAKKYGADLVLDYKSQTQEEIQKEILKFSNNKGVNCVFDCVGSQNSKLYLKILSEDSTWILYGLLGKSMQEQFDYRTILFKRIKLIGSVLRNRSLEYKQKLCQDFQNDIIPLFKNNEIQGVVDSVFEIDFTDNTIQQIQQSQQRMIDNKTMGRIIIKIK